MRLIRRIIKIDLNLHKYINTQKRKYDNTKTQIRQHINHYKGCFTYQTYLSITFTVLTTIHITKETTAPL